jgi:hypothetical protein
MRIYVFFPIVLSLVLPAALAEESAKTGTTAMANAEGNYTIKDFHFADGETLPQLRITTALWGNRSLLQGVSQTRFFCCMVPA